MSARPTANRRDTVARLRPTIRRREPSAIGRKVSSTEAEWGVLCGTFAQMRESVTRHKPKLRPITSQDYYHNDLSHGGEAPATVSG